MRWFSYSMKIILFYEVWSQHVLSSYEESIMYIYEKLKCLNYFNNTNNRCINIIYSCFLRISYVIYFKICLNNVKGYKLIFFLIEHFMILGR